jgi:hypothetical protein
LQLVYFLEYPIQFAIVKRIVLSKLFCYGVICNILFSLVIKLTKLWI